MTTAAPWIQAQTLHLLAQRGHAWLLHGPSGLGQYDLALELAKAWLCEHATPQGACGSCGSCHAVAVRTHADLCVLMPETRMLELGWPLSEKAQSEIDDKKRKPSKEIRVDAMRDAVEFSQRTSARGRGKVVVVYPAEAMNAITANTLLKTLEEPVGDVKFVLASESAAQLLPTVRSRCLGHTMHWPDTSLALAWLEANAISSVDARTFLQAAGGRPEAALHMLRTGWTAAAWSAFPKAMQRGDLDVVKDWTAPQLVDALQKLCHDALASGVGATPRFFSSASLPGHADIAALTQWGKDLAHLHTTVEHPFQAGLMLEALVGQAQTALNSTTVRARP